ncbi:MAG: DNA-directed RNA polymerase subunit K, partial [Rectinema sp.]|nr:DNA-directed RNA polymerase subunit K [Rectinema sp.]
MTDINDFSLSIDEARRMNNFGIYYKSFISPPWISGKSRHGDFMKYTRFEKARIIGARALQISLGAPVLIDVPESVIDPI